MIVENNFISKLKDFGLNSYEAKLWTALLSRGVSTAGELSDIANVPRSRTYDVLESLEKKGFIIMKIGKPIKYLAVEPTEVVSRVQKNIVKEAEEKAKLVDELKKSTILEELSLLHNQGIEMVNPSDLAGSFRGRDSSYEHMDAMLKSAEKTIMIASTGEGLLHKLPYFQKTLEQVKKRGVDIKIVVDHLPKEIDVSNFTVKITPKLRSRFVIVDNEEVFFMLLDDKDVHQSYDTGIWINSSFFASALSQLFEIAFEEIKTISK